MNAIVFFFICALTNCVGHEYVDVGGEKSESNSNKEIQYKMLTTFIKRKVEVQKQNGAVSKVLLALRKRNRNKLKHFEKEESKERRKRSLGSVKIRGLLSPYDEGPPPALPSLIALVFLDIIAGIFILNVIAILALLFVANN